MALDDGSQYVLQAGTAEPRRGDFARVLLDVADNDQVAQIEPEDCRRIANWLAPVDASEFEEIRAAREDQLRQLLSYCRSNGSETPVSYAEDGPEAGRVDVYNELGDRLEQILDGED